MSSLQIRDPFEKMRAGRDWIGDMPDVEDMMGRAMKQLNQPFGSTMGGMGGGMTNQPFGMSSLMNRPGMGGGLMNMPSMGGMGMQDPIQQRALGAILNSDLVETPSHFSISVDLPGIRPEDLDVEITEGYLTIKGDTTQHYERAQGDVFRAVERHHGHAQRTMALPPGVDANKAETVLENGVLTVTLPKLAPLATVGPPSRKLQIQTGKPKHALMGAETKEGSSQSEQGHHKSRKSRS